MAKEVAVQIDKLVIPELSTWERRRLVSALEEELLRLVREHGVPTRLQSGAPLRLADAGIVAVGDDVKPDAIGRRLATKIYSELARGE